MRFTSIASGSSGNCTYVGSENTHILVDAGVSKKRIEEGLKGLDLGLSDISARARPVSTRMASILF